MRNFSYVIQNPLGLHARVAGMIASKALSSKSQIEIQLGKRRVDARDLVGMMGLLAVCGDRLQVEISGGDEERACEEIKRIMEENL